MELKVSVVINTYNRAKSLAVTLESLYYQTNENFEVIVVNGPSTDETSEVIAKYDGKIKLVHCPVRNLSVSRNLGIEAASGDIVAFIDDDAIADPNWIRDVINGYSETDIGGVGGLVYDHTGMQLQYHYSACDRIGDTDFNIEPPFSQYCIPGGQKFLYLQGTNCSFRKSCLEMIGGFDEEFEYYLDEVDVCMRIIDSGYLLKPLDNAVVHHKYMASFLRNEKKVVLHPYSTVKNKYYFAVKNNSHRTDDGLMESLGKWSEEVRAGGLWNHKNKLMSDEELDTYLREVDDACKDGISRGRGTPKTRRLSTAKSDCFLPFPIVDRREKPLKICYLSKEYPPVNFGGIGRYTYDLATTFASKGHEVHVITEGAGQDTVDFEDGVWVHRLVSKLYKPFEDMALGWNFSLQARNYFEVERIHLQSPVDIVNGPIWLCETGMVNCGGKYPALLTLMTTQRILNKLTQMPEPQSHEYKLMELEEADLAQHEYIHAISHSILNNCAESISQDAYTFIVPLGCRDLSQKFTPRRQDNKIVIYSVGRLEHRKGTDLLLRAAETILGGGKHDNVEFVIAGKETTNTDTGVSYKESFLKRNKGKAQILEHVRFLGEVSEEELMQNYCDADIACTPSRYESFGIVLLEGMSFKNAIVAARVGGMQDIIEDGKTGVFFKADCAEDLAEKLELLINESEYRRQLAENAYVEYHNTYSMEAVYQNLYARYVETIHQFAASAHSADSSFNRRKYAEMIAKAENMDLEKAMGRVNELLDQHIVSDISPLAANQAKLPPHLRCLRKCYHVLRKVFPTMAVRLRNLWLRHYTHKKKGRMAAAIRRVYRFIVKIPIVGLLVRYLVNLILLPLRVEKSNALCNQLLNNDELLKQIGNMVEQQAGKNRDVIWKVDSDLNELSKKMSEMTREMQNIYSGFKEEITAIRNEQNEMLQKKILSGFAESLNELQNKVMDILTASGKNTTKELSYAMEDYSNRSVDALSKRITDSRSEILFELMRDKQIETQKAQKKEPKICNPQKLQAAQKTQNMRLNLGAGHICYDEYLNVDEREIDNIDIVADVRELPLPAESVDEIYASHLIEHFTKNELTKNILPHWISKLKKGGRLRVILPDLESMIMHYQENSYDISDLREVLYGLQEYPGDIHYALYGQKELQDIFERFHLKASYTFTNRKNGKCYDMELTGIKDF